MERLSDKLLDIINNQDFCFTAEEMRMAERAIGRLSAYENTDLTPDEIELMKGSWRAVCKEYGLNGRPRKDADGSEIDN